MSVREYIGARYVPIFADPIQWDPTNIYEPLTVVMNEGSSYVSRKSVPAGIQLNNDDYWILWADYNAQLQHYIDEVETFDGRIDTLEGKFPVDTADIADDAITADKIDDGAVGTAAIADDAITADKIDDGAVGSAAIADGAITKNKIASGVINTPICVDDFGAVGDGVTDNTAILQDIIDNNPNAQLLFKEGIYIITDTLIVPGDTSSVGIDLNGCILRYNGTFTDWSEGDAVTYRADYPYIPVNPIPMIGIVRTNSTIGNTCSIENGTIDCNYKAHIGIMNRAFVSSFHNIRFENFMFTGLFNGSFIDNISSQTMIDSCYFTRGSDQSTRETSAMYFTSFDNNITNCVTNRSKYGITFRCGGNYVSNCHFTIQYETMPLNYTGASIRIYPTSLGDSQINRFSNCYFNAGKYVCQTYNNGVSGYMDMRTLFSDCDYVFYSSGGYYDLYNQRLDLAWFGGELNGVWTANQCGIIYGGNTRFYKEIIPAVGSFFLNNAKEISIVNTLGASENRIIQSMNNLVNNGETICAASGAAPVPIGKYRLVARLVTSMPAQTNLIEGDIRYTFTSGNNNLAKHGTITAGSSTYTVDNHNDIGTAGVQCYISKNVAKYTLGGVDYYYSDIFLYNPTNADITARLYMTLECASPFVDIYAIPNAVNFESGIGQNVFNSFSAANLVQLF